MLAPFQIVPHHVRRGLRRLYFIVSVPWIIWFGIQIANILNYHRYWRLRQIEHPLIMMLLIPVGAPIFCAIVAWIVAGFADTESTIDHRKIIEKCIAELERNNHFERQRIYDYGLISLTEMMQRQSPLPRATRIEFEKQSFIAAARKIETAESNREKFQARRLGKGSTTLLALSMFFPQLWITDATCMSVYWVARAP